MRFFQGGQQRSTGVCLLQCSGKMRLAPPASIISELNKVLMGMQWGREQQFYPGRGVGQRVDDDTNRSISSIEEDFLTASEHLGDDSEDDGLRNGDLHHSLAKGFALEMYKFNARLSKTGKKNVTCNLFFCVLFLQSVPTNYSNESWYTRYRKYFKSR